MPDQQPEAGVINMAIVEDQAELRDGLAFLIDSTPGYRCRHRYGSMEEALRLISRDPPAVALVDIGLPGMLTACAS
jgi:DNA-binding NarL/FixJ family response regulator